MRTVRVGEASHPGPPMVAPSFLQGPIKCEQIRGVVLDDEELVPPTVPASSADVRRFREVDQSSCRLQAISCGVSDDR